MSSEKFRLRFQEELEAVMGDSGKVYYLPESNVTIDYPCIVYELKTQETSYCNNRVYNTTDTYDVTIIDPDPTSDIRDRLIRHGFNGIRFDRRYKSDSLYHTVYQINYTGVM